MQVPESKAPNYRRHATPTGCVSSRWMVGFPQQLLDQINALFICQRLEEECLSFGYLPCPGRDRLAAPTAVPRGGQRCPEEGRLHHQAPLEYPMEQAPIKAVTRPQPRITSMDIKSETTLLPGQETQESQGKLHQFIRALNTEIQLVFPRVIFSSYNPHRRDRHKIPK